MGDYKILGQNIEEEKETIVNIQVSHLPTRTPIDIPMYVYRAKEEGPHILFSAGLHGDEINGVEIVRNILDQNLNHVKKGMVICVPIINVYGFLYFSRYVPDGKDVNRSFPGSKNGSLASKVAHAVMQHIVPYIEYGIDFHTGGDQRTNYPQMRGDFSDQTVKDLAVRTGAPFLIHSKMIARSFRSSAYEKGKKLLVYEGGESIRFDDFAIQEGINCAHRFLQQFGMSVRMPEPVGQSIEIKQKTWYRGPASGMWIPQVHAGDWVEKGQPMGYITSPYGDFKSEVITQKSGYVIGLNNHAVVNKGDALIHLGIAD